jgi:hypothetical protein
MLRENIDPADVSAAVAKQGYWFGSVGCLASSELLELATKLGKPVADARDRCLVKPVSPASNFAAPPNTLSSRYGLGAFPFHTDGAHWLIPPDLLLMYCVAEGSGARATLLHDTTAWELDAGERRVLRNEPWCVTQVAKPFLCSHLGPTERFRVNYDCMRPCSASSHAGAIIAGRLAGGPTRSIPWSAGKMLLIDNARMLHARGQANKPDPDRHHLRILMRRHEMGQ